MTEHPTPDIVLGLPVPTRPAAKPFDVLLATSAAAFMGIYVLAGSAPDDQILQDAIAAAERLLDLASAEAATLREALRPAPDDEIARSLLQFVAAWPNASRGDLAGYGALLLDDVSERQPCRYALRAGLRHLRQTSRFLPSIAEVLAALDEAHARLRNTVFHIEQLPVVLERARADLAAERRAAR